MKLKSKGLRNILAGVIFIFFFAIFTWLIQNVDVKPNGVNGSDIGFSTVNHLFHDLFGVNMTLYTVTDWAGLLPMGVVFAFGIFGLVQLIKRRSFIKVDADILILGGYYIIIAILYIAFEMVPINFRPILIDGFMETSYPSSTTLLVMGVMPTLTEQIDRRCKEGTIKTIVKISVIAFSLFMVIGRLVSGVHWMTDIIGSAFVSIGLFYIYRGLVLVSCKDA